MTPLIPPVENPAGSKARAGAYRKKDPGDIRFEYPLPSNAPCRKAGAFVYLLQEETPCSKTSRRPKSRH